MDEVTLAQLAIFMRSRDYAEKTINNYVSTNRRWSIDPATIDRASIRDWVWSADTQSKRRHRWLAMRRLVECLQDLEVLDGTFDYCAGMKMPQEALKVQPAVDDDAVAALLSACAGKRFIDRRDKALVLMLLCTGMRSSELLAMRVDDLNLTDASAVVRARGTSRGKTSEERTTYLDEPALRSLFLYLRAREMLRASTPMLWLTRQGHPAKPTLVRDVLRARIPAGVHVTPHMFRRRLAITWLSRGGSQVGLQTMAGWSTPYMAWHYSRSAAADVAKAEHSRVFGTDQHKLHPR